jgi:hypothetical protein
VEVRWHYKHGLVSHALAAALRALLQDYLIMVAQLEHQFRLGKLSMQGLLFYCQVGAEIRYDLCTKSLRSRAFKLSDVV